MKLNKKLIALIIVLAVLLLVAGYVLGRSSLNTNNADVNTNNSVDIGQGIGNQNSNSNVTEQPDPEPQTQPQTQNSADNGPEYYDSSVLNELTDTENFAKTALEHIFIGSVNSNNKGSGYHYAMISDAKGEIVEGTKSKLDTRGIYKAEVTVSGRAKDGISTFFPDDWSPQEIVDAINIAREDALKNNRTKGSTYVGYYEGIEIRMYLDTKDRVVTAYPVYKSGD